MKKLRSPHDQTYLKRLPRLRGGFSDVTKSLVWKIMRHLKSMFAQNSRYFNSLWNNSNVLSDNFSTEIHGWFKKNNVTSFLVMFDYACHIYTNYVYFSQLILIKLWGLVRFRLFLYFHLGVLKVNISNHFMAILFLWLPFCSMYQVQLYSLQW